MDLDYASLREQGIRHLEQMAGGLWTDFNAHDPGITILELLCYALTDLGYRSSFDVPDLLASGGGDPYESLHRPSQVLSCHPVTLLDLRKLIIDVEGVRNAWIEPDQPEIELHYHPVLAELGHVATPPVTEPVKLDGLYRVWIELSELAAVDGTAVRAAVARLLYAHRALCQDFTAIQVLSRDTSKKIQVHADIEIGQVEDAESVQVEILEAIADHLSPPVPFLSLGEMLERGYSVDEIFEGPLLRHGFIEPGALERIERRSWLNTSDLIRVIMDVPGVRAISRIEVSAGKELESWSLKLDPAAAPQLDLNNSKISLERAGIPAGVKPSRVQALYDARRRRAASDRSALGFMTDEESLAPPRGRDRAVGRYRSAQRLLPALYGIGELGLPASAAPERRARAKQLKAYLMFFDQLLANYFAQLGNVGQLYAHGGEDLRTYFHQTIDEPDLELDEVAVRDRAGRQARLTEITEDSRGDSSASGAAALDRKNRFLNHLLARFGEEFTDYSLVLFDAMVKDTTISEEKLIRDKQAFLRRYPRVSGARGTARDDLQPTDGASVSGLEDRIRLKLGLSAELGERMLLVEHILLRPTADDQAQDVPLLAAARRQDPYSLQLSFVFPKRGRLSRATFRRFAEQTVREETPAHLTAYVQWLPSDDWPEMERAHLEWLERRRKYLSSRVGIVVDELEA